jgi:hypothetical protein
VISYGVLVMFLAAPPVVATNQYVGSWLRAAFPVQTLAVESYIPPSVRDYATSEALELVWVGQSPKTSFTQSERRHLLDVHRLFVWMSFGVGCAVITSILLEKEVIDGRVWRDARFFIRGAAVLSVLVVIFFPWFFEFFHRVFFPQGNYSFTPESLIIQCFPPYFWLINAVWLQGGMILLMWWQARHAQNLDI